MDYKGRYNNEYSMIIQDLEQLKNAIQQVLIDEGFIDFCQNCPVPLRCCNILDPFCEFLINKQDCAENSGEGIGGKKFRCFLYICPILNKKNPEVSNWLMRIRSKTIWPNTNAANEIIFPLEIEEFGK